MFDGGFSAASLAVFTALAPAGAVAFACLAAFLLVNRSQSRDWRDALAHLLFILSLLLGLDSSRRPHIWVRRRTRCTLLMGWGVHRLSNEVVSAVAFLFFAGNWRGCIPTAKSRKRL